MRQAIDRQNPVHRRGNKAMVVLIASLFIAVCTLSAARTADIIRDYTVANVVRTSDRTNDAGRYLPPWNRVEIWGASFKTKPIIGDDVTAVAFVPGIQPLTLTISDVIAEEACVDDEPTRWRVELEPVTRTDFFDATPVDGDRAEETPFDVAVLYPAVAAVSRVDRQGIDPADIPDGFARAHVRGAIDFAGDGRPEVLFIDFCTKMSERTLDPAQCEYLSSRTYVRSTGRWDRVDEIQPC
jgi:hypothetical protein